MRTSVRSVDAVQRHVRLQQQHLIVRRFTYRTFEYLLVQLVRLHVAREGRVVQEPLRAHVALQRFQLLRAVHEHVPLQAVAVRERLVAQHALEPLLVERRRVRFLPVHGDVLDELLARAELGRALGALNGAALHEELALVAVRVRGQARDGLRAGPVHELVYVVQARVGEAEGADAAAPRGRFLGDVGAAPFDVLAVGVREEVLVEAELLEERAAAEGAVDGVAALEPVEFLRARLGRVVGRVVRVEMPLQLVRGGELRRAFVAVPAVLLVRARLENGQLPLGRVRRPVADLETIAFIISLARISGTVRTSNSCRGRIARVVV